MRNVLAEGQIVGSLLLFCLLGMALCYGGQHLAFRMKQWQSEAARGASGPPPEGFQWEAAKLLYFMPMNGNRVGLEDLVAIPGIGAATASRFLEYRSQMGFFLLPGEFDSLAAPYPMRVGAVLKGYLEADEFNS